MKQLLKTNSVEHYVRYNHRRQIDGLVEERRNSSALALNLRLSCTNLSKYTLSVWIKHMYTNNSKCVPLIFEELVRPMTYGGHHAVSSEAVHCLQGHQSLSPRAHCLVLTPRPQWRCPRCDRSNAKISPIPVMLNLLQEAGTHICISVILRQWDEASSWISPGRRRLVYPV